MENKLHDQYFNKDFECTSTTDVKHRQILKMVECNTFTEIDIAMDNNL